MTVDADCTHPVPRWPLPGYDFSGVHYYSDYFRAIAFGNLWITFRAKCPPLSVLSGILDSRLLSGIGVVPDTEHQQGAPLRRGPFFFAGVSFPPNPEMTVRRCTFRSPHLILTTNRGVAMTHSSFLATAPWMIRVRDAMR